MVIGASKATWNVCFKLHDGMLGGGIGQIVSPKLLDNLLGQDEVGIL